MTYVPKTAPPHPLGLHRPKFEEIRKQRGLDERGFKIEGKTEDDLSAWDESE